MILRVSSGVRATPANNVHTPLPRRVPTFLDIRRIDMSMCRISDLVSTMDELEDLLDEIHPPPGAERLNMRKSYDLIDKVRRGLEDLA